MQFGLGIELQNDRAFIAAISKKGSSLLLEYCNTIYFSDTHELKNELKKFFSNHRSWKHNVAISIPVKNTILRKFSVAFSGRQQIDQIIHYETENYIHSKEIEDLIVDYVILNQEPQKTKLSVAAVPIALISKQLQLIDECGVHPFIIDIDLFGLYYFLTTTKRQQKNCILVHLRENTCNFLVVQDGRVHDVRKLNMASSWLTTDNSSMGITTEINVEKIGSQSIDLQKYSQRLIRELKKTFLTMNVVEGVYFCGDKHICSEICERTSTKLKVKCYRWQVSDSIKSKINEDTSDVVAATGLALRAIQQVEGFNFRKQQFAYKNALNLLRMPLAVLLFFVTLFITTISFYYSQQTNIERKSYENLQNNARKIYKRNLTTKLKAKYWQEISKIKQKMQDQIVGPQYPLPYDMVNIWNQVSEVADKIRRRHYLVIDRVFMNQNEINFYGRTNDDVCLDLFKLHLKNKSWIDPQDDALQVVESEKLERPKDSKLPQSYQYFIRLKNEKKSFDK
ncbi:pilus assembly protein PilM [Candidatus Uabimicrobium sp. HlEnr_7]|uniref:pilus assembly protein PilM n=1 Tax=Candidatus Uabimicrobium helgolandensis TaxID=3095367 RepID=UPI0035579ED2